MHSLHLKVNNVNCTNNQQAINRSFTLVEELGLHVRNSVYHEFYPHGLTFTVILSESHMTISTWPEDRMVQIDLFLCNSDSTNIFKKAIDQAVSIFSATEFDYMILDRNMMCVMPL